MASKFSPTTATSVVIANMIGTGVFTSLGFQLIEFTSPTLILMLWALGGVLALTGAMTYAELGAALPRNGGEYHFLSELAHPAAGFVSGWVSATIGFAAPIALAAMTFASYLAAIIPGLPKTWVAAGLIVLVGMVHAVRRSTSGQFQVLFTTIKVVLVIGFSIAALIWAQTPQTLDWSLTSADLELTLTAGFAVSLIYVNYAYTGWNAATYLAGELDDAQRNLPKVLIFGTGVVMVLYVLLNGVFLAVAPVEEMAGKVEVGHVAAVHAFGELAGNGFAAVLAVLLVSTVSAMVMAGPRVLQVIGEDFPALRALSTTNRDDIPVRAIVLLCAIAIVLVFTAAFDAILVFTGFTLALNTFATVASVFVLRKRGDARPFSMPWFPLPPIIFLTITGWTMIYLVMERPVEALWTLGIIVVGLGMYAASRQRH